MIFGGLSYASTTLLPKSVFLYILLKRNLSNLNPVVRGVSDSPAGGLPNLESLQVSHNRLGDTQALRHLARCEVLSCLDLSHNKLQDPDIVQVYIPPSSSFTWAPLFNSSFDLHHQLQLLWNKVGALIYMRLDHQIYHIQGRGWECS